MNPNFTKQRFKNLPENWSLTWSSSHDINFIQRYTGFVTTVHPYQSEATKTYGDNFNLTDAFQRVYRDALGRSSGTPAEHLEVTIEVLALDFQYLQGVSNKDPRNYEKSTEPEQASYWIELPTLTQSEGLCDVCSHIDFNYMTSPNISMTECSFVFKPLHSIWQDTSCSFCRLVGHCAIQHLLPELVEQAMHHVRVIRCIIGHKPRTIPTWYSAPIYIQFPDVRKARGDPVKIHIHSVLEASDDLPEPGHKTSNAPRDWYPVEDHVSFEAVRSFPQETEQR